MMERLGVQTFTIRNQIKTPAEIRKTFTELHSIGYKHFELARMKYDQAELDVLKSLKEELGIEYFTSQIKLKVIKRDFDWLMKFSKELGIPTIEVSVIPAKAFLRKEKGMLELAKELNELGRKTKEHGVELLFHHHNFELIEMGNELGIEHLINNTDANLCNFVIDTYWLARSGFNPYSFIKKHEARIRGVHLRDSRLIQKGIGFNFKDAAIGKGTIDFTPIKEATFPNIMFYSVEQDSQNPIDDLEFSYQHLDSL